MRDVIALSKGKKSDRQTRHNIFDLAATGMDVSYRALQDVLREAEGGLPQLFLEGGEDCGGPGVSITYQGFAPRHGHCYCVQRNARMRAGCKQSKTRYERGALSNT